MVGVDDHPGGVELPPHLHRREILNPDSHRATPEMVARRTHAEPVRQAACNTRAMEPSDAETCIRCGRPAEAGNVYASPVGLTGGGTIGWMPDDAGSWRRLRSRGEPLIDRLFGNVTAPAMRCPVCRLVWFEYPSDESPRLHDP